jgi:hypothetical protein
MIDVVNTRLTPELRRQIRYAIDRSFSEGNSNADGLFTNIVDLLEAPFVDSQTMQPSASALMRALETLGAKAVGQVEYWRRKQTEFPGVEDYFDEDGILQLPAEIGPLLSGRSANGCYSEADWWLSTIREAAGEVARASAVERSYGDLKAFADAMIACAFEGGDAGGDFIQDKAVEFGLIKETVVDGQVHTDPNGWAKNGDAWFVKTDALTDFGRAALEVSSDDDLKMIERLREIVPSMGKSTWEIQNSTWDFEAREGRGESLVFREASANMIPFSTRTAICRAPKLMDSEHWEPVARYITAASPAAVAALMKAHDALEWELERLTAERDKQDVKLREHRLAEARACTGAAEALSVTGVDVALSKIVDEQPMFASDAIHGAWSALGNKYAWHIRFPRAEQFADFAPALLEAFEAKKEKDAGRRSAT